MTTATQAAPGNVDERELAGAGMAYVLHTLIDLAPVTTEAGRAHLHELVTTASTFGLGESTDAVFDPAGWSNARANGAYDPPAAPPAPVDPRDAQIAALTAQINALSASQGSPADARQTGGVTGTSSPVVPAGAAAAPPAVSTPASVPTSPADSATSDAPPASDEVQTSPFGEPTEPPPVTGAPDGG